MARNAKNWLLALFILGMSLNFPSPLAYGQTGSENTRNPGNWIATAYCRCRECTGDGDGITASGARAAVGRTVAINWLPFGKRVRINGKVYVVEDRGAVSHFGSRKHPKKRVDIFMADHQTALRWGRRYVKLEVLE